jgi:hypothetical protein
MLGYAKHRYLAILPPKALQVSWPRLIDVPGGFGVRVPGLRG